MTEVMMVVVDGEDSGGDGGNHDGSDDGDDEGPRGQKSLSTDVCPALRMEADTTCPPLIPSE